MSAQTTQEREPMSAERDDAGRSAAPPPPPAEEMIAETLTDFIDRMDREAFRRSLEQRDLRVIATRVRAQR
jgi:hypothetical protein